MNGRTNDGKKVAQTARAHGLSLRRLEKMLEESAVTLRCGCRLELDNPTCRHGNANPALKAGLA